MVCWTDAREHQDLPTTREDNRWQGLSECKDTHLRCVDGSSSTHSNTCQSVQTRRRSGTTHDTTTSFLALTSYSSPFRSLNCTPTARGALPSTVSSRTRVTCACVAIVRFDRASTSGVRYADSVVTRRPFESMNVTAKLWSAREQEHWQSGTDSSFE